MREENGDLWSYAGRGVLVVTTNGSVTRDGRAVLGRGCCLQAADRFPGLQRRLGELVRANGNHVQVLCEGLVSFPVEESAWSLPDPALIARSAAELRALADREGWGIIVVPRPGCGGGGLLWENVRPVVAPFFDDRFIVIGLSR